MILNIPTHSYPKILLTNTVKHPFNPDMAEPLNTVGTGHDLATQHGGNDHPMLRLSIQKGSLIQNPIPDVEPFPIPHTIAEGVPILILGNPIRRSQRTDALLVAHTGETIRVTDERRLHILDPKIELLQS